MGRIMRIVRSGNGCWERRLRIAALLLAVVLIVLGLIQGDYAVIWNKAVRICYSCIGLG